VTEPSGINDAGLIVGSAGQNPVVGFLYDGTTFTPIQHGHDNATIALGINNASDVVGGTGTIYTTKAFELRSGRFRDISPPGTYIYIYATGINNFGKIVGWTDDDGFAYDGGKFKRIAFPGANQTEAWGINDKGVIVGWYASSECICAFALRTGRYLSFRYPGAAGTLAYGINNLGQVVGGYTFDYETWHGFVTSPITAGDFASSACCQGAAAKRNQ
jgi:probable HAF family extracellular repeat protein